MGLLIAGTSSDAGKSLITTGLCRAFSRRGISVAPYKAQNMSNNSMVVPGGEIGRAQWIQALAAGVPPELAMNPVLLKPGTDKRSHVVLMGKPHGTLGSQDFIEGRKELARTAFAAYDDLSSRYEVIIAEGAGSPTEINLRQSDYVNMALAQHGSLPTVIVGDIDRGGVFAALYGTVALLSASDQQLIAGFIVNKFRGDETLLQPAIDQLELQTGRTTYGVVPWHSDVWLDSEDALDISSSAAILSARRVSAGTLDDTQIIRIAVIKFPRISNFTDIDALGIEPGVDIFFVTSPADLMAAEVILLPGTRATLADLQWLRSRGFDEAIANHIARGRVLVGICGGCQMLGELIDDSNGIEGSAHQENGLGFLPLKTEFFPEKQLAEVTGNAYGEKVTGYEIHHGKLSIFGGDSFPGGASQNNIFGTMWHGIFETDEFRWAWLTLIATELGKNFQPQQASFKQARHNRLELLGDLAEAHLDIDALIELATASSRNTSPVIVSGIGAV